jgi:hypothetical protein
MYHMDFDFRRKYLIYVEILQKFVTIFLRKEMSKCLMIKYYPISKHIS